jgi:hypothetical protein
MAGNELFSRLPTEAFWVKSETDFRKKYALI